MSILSPIENAGKGEARRDTALNLLRIHRAAIIRELTRAAVRLGLRTVRSMDAAGKLPAPDTTGPKGGNLCEIGASYVPLAPPPSSSRHHLTYRCRTAVAG